MPQQSYAWFWRAADVTFTAQILCIVKRDGFFCARKPAFSIFSAFKLPQSVATSILRTLPKSWHDFQCNIMNADQFTRVVQVRQLRRIRLVNISRACLEYSIYKYGPPTTIPYRNNNSKITSKCFSKCTLIITNHKNVITFSFHLQTNELVA